MKGMYNFNCSEDKRMLMELREANAKEYNETRIPKFIGMSILVFTFISMGIVVAISYDYMLHPAYDICNETRDLYDATVESCTIYAEENPDHTVQTFIDSIDPVKNVNKHLIP